MNVDRHLIIKKGVRMAGLQREALAGIDLCLDVFTSIGCWMRLTSGRGDGHGWHSHHYKGLAWDMGSKEFSTREKKELLAGMKAKLGPKYQVMLEYEGTENEHFHAEYDPGHARAYPKL